MKNIFMPVLICLISTTLFAQKVAVSGVVHDLQGKPIPFVFIKDAEHSYATYTDPSGAFSLYVDASSRLIASTNNYKEMVVKVTDPQNVSITMTPLAEQGTTYKSTGSGEDFKVGENRVDMTEGSRTLFGSGKDGLHGSPYLFDHWVHGFVIDPKDSVKQNNIYMFNYQKVDGTLLYTDNGRTKRQIDKGDVKSFTFFDDDGQSFVFENVPAIDPRHYVEVLASGSKYKIYKLITTTFIQSNYVTNGITSSGHNYDEFADENTYYAVKVQGGQPQKFALKAKALKAVFADDVAKVSKYLSDNDSDIDDNYLKGLGEYLNN